jgi:hypothetical protein
VLEDKPLAPVILTITLSFFLSYPNHDSAQSFSAAASEPEALRAVAARSLSQRYSYRTYSNARYGFSIAYPAGLLIPQGESDNGDGQKFASRDGSAVLTAYGSNRMDRSLREEYQSAQADRTVTYRLLGRDMFVVSGIAGGKIFYQKTLLRSDAFKTFIIEYDESDRSTFDPVTTRIARSFVG